MMYNALANWVQRWTNAFQWCTMRCRTSTTVNKCFSMTYNAFMNGYNGEQMIFNDVLDNTRRAGGAKRWVIHFRFFLSSTYNMSIIGLYCVNWRIWVRSQKWTKIGTPLPGYLVLKSVSGGPFFEHLLICAYGERRQETETGEAGRTLAPGGPEERNKRFAQLG